MNEILLQLPQLHRLGPTARQNFTLRSIVQLLWVNVRLYLTLKVDVIYVKSTLHNALKADQK